MNPVFVGQVVSISGQTITMSHDDGSADAAHEVAHDAKVTLNGNAATLAELKAGDAVTVTGAPATKVVAKR